MDDIATRVPRCLAIAGSDSGGGAGIQADLKTFSALGCYGMSAITALTAQNTVTVSGIHPVPPDMVAAQIDAVLEDIGADAVKTGMLFSAPIIDTVVERLAAHGVTRLVVDPVMVAASGARLLAEDAVAAVRDRLIPVALVATPNLPELEALVGGPLGTESERLAAGRRLLDLGPEWVVVKGGHAEGDAVDFLLGRDGTEARLSVARVDTPNNHGTGCSFASAIAAGVARGRPVPEAVREAKDWLTEALRQAYPVGRGHGPVHHFHRWW